MNREPETNQESLGQLIPLLTEIRDNQRLQLERQKQALDLQEQQFTLVRDQQARAAKLQDRAESLQERSAAMVDRARKVFLIVLPLLLVLIAYVSWILFGYF